jgi:signal transduction histidine kinase
VIQKIQGSVDAMEDLFVTLLDISKLDARAVRPSVVDFPLEDILRRARSTFAPVAEQKGLELRVDRSTAVVRTDPALLERILFNLVSNGIRYTLKGGVRVFAAPGESTLTMTVEDTGIGIPEEYRDRIYDEFFQIAALPTRGLGLGLSIVKQSAELLGHALSLQSRLVWFELSIGVTAGGSGRPRRDRAFAAQTRERAVVLGICCDHRR